MSFNVIAYCIYAILMAAVIVKVGWVCYANGNVYVAYLMPEQIMLSQQINKILLLGYYLVNIGYSIFMISTWTVIENWQEVIAQIAEHSGQIVLILCGLHYLNIVGINFLFNKQKQFKTF